LFSLLSVGAVAFPTLTFLRVSSESYGLAFSEEVIDGPILEISDKTPPPPSSPPPPFPLFFPSLPPFFFSFSRLPFLKDPFQVRFMPSPPLFLLLSPSLLLPPLPTNLNFLTLAEISVPFAFLSLVFSPLFLPPPFVVHCCYFSRTTLLSLAPGCSRLLSYL